MSERRYDGSEIAIVGLDCRFPGAGDPEAFWRNLRAGVESIVELSEEEILAAGERPERLGAPGYVRRAPVLEDVERFDAPFFGYNEIEARLMDPQQRLLLEVAWGALEDAGYDPAAHAAPIGVFAGSKTNTYLFHLASDPEVLATTDPLQLVLGGDQAMLATRVSYKLGLRGPSYSVQTACSTSLVALHLACQSLLLGECRMALAGGVCVNVPHRAGYLHQEGGIVSPDGHCRAFDARAAGTVFGSGVGVVALKRLEDALTDGDRVRAVVLGSATNNDGAGKATFTAPDVDGQARVIVEALAVAGVEADSISYVEGHGTGTALGDPIEVLALTQAFRAGTGRTGFCGLGSVKSNVGHLDAAAGMSSLLKTVLALEHEELPPSLHFETPNPRIDFEGSPFRVVDRLRPWRRGEAPRRAGVSSFGFGGTNAHVILEEAPAPPAAAPSRERQLLVFSARTEEALEAATDRLAEHLREHPDLPLADVTFTLWTGRRTFEHRRYLTAASVEKAAEALVARDPVRLVTGREDAVDRPVAFLFPGQGAQYPGMARGLYDAEPAFRRELDRIAELAGPLLGRDLLPLVFGSEGADGGELRHTAVAQVALFTVEVALARALATWGVRPSAVAGHSLGEYSAACVAGVFSVEEGLSLVAARGRWMGQMPDGAMLSVDLPPERVEALLAGEAGADLSLAAVNGPASCAVSGPVEAVDRFVHALEALGDGVAWRRLETSHAFHSAMMEPALEPFAAEVAEVSLSRPEVPLFSNLTGARVGDEVLRPEHWAEHLRRTVRFSDCLAGLLEDPEVVLLEVGPGTTLGSLALRHPARRPRQAVISTLRHPRDARADGEVLLDALGRLWLAGARLDPAAYWDGEGRRRVPLPTYPFAGDRYWLAPARAQAPVAPARRDDPGEWLYRPAWETGEGEGEAATGGRWLLLSDGSALASGLAERLREAGHTVAEASVGKAFRARNDDRFEVDPLDPEALGALVDAVAGASGENGPLRIVHLWDLDPEAPAERRVELAYHAPVALARVLADRPGLPVCLDRVSIGLHALADGDLPDPVAALSLGPVLVLPQELPHVVARSVDLRRGEDDAVGRLAAELARWPDVPEVALGAGGRRVRRYRPVAVEAPASLPGRLREGGVYLVFGGLGRLGSAVAEALAGAAHARLVLAGRTVDEEGSAEALRRVRAAVEALGGEAVAIRADLADPASVRAAVEATRERFGALHGVVHAAGVASGPSFRPAAELRRDDAELHFAPRVEGVRYLAAALDETGAAEDLDFVLVNASLASVLGGLGNAAYTAASRFLDAFAEGRRKAGSAPWLVADWDAWADGDGASGGRLAAAGVGATLVELAVRRREGIELLGRLLQPSCPPHLVVSTGDLDRRLAQWIRAGAPAAAAPAGGEGRTPTDPAELERRVLGLWKRVLGRDEVGLEENFFDLGGNSLNGMQLLAELSRELGVQLPPVTLFEAPTVAALVRRLLPEDAGPAPEARSATSPRGNAVAGGDLAVVGMACRLPGADGPDALWESLRAGREAIHPFTDEELLSAGVDPALLADPAYVRARPILEGADLFDAGLFGFSPREAELMDPQHRVFLECCWQALCHAGRDPARHPGRIGVFAGASLGTYLLGLAADPELIAGLDPLQAIIANDKDSLTTTVSYKLGLRGPSVAVQSYCSTSLVAVHLARRSLLDGECDLALAGGVSIAVPQGGYLYRDGGILSPDGRCRPFDAAASGTLFGDGAGVVVLKRLEDALADGDTVHALIKGSAVNNDGSVKAGFTAPSVEGQAEVVRAALAVAGVEPSSIGYLEAHGTGTPLGDPIEVAALARVFAPAAPDAEGGSGQGRCALGSIKGNVGHLDRAAGVAGLIKTVLTLGHREIPPSLHFEAPNPKIDFGATPFFVADRLRPWKADGGPRRAGVSALGFGGTNAHVVLEEAPEAEAPASGRPAQLLVLSSHAPAALDATAAGLAGFLEGCPDDELPDVAYTLQVGRPVDAHRRAVVCAGAAEGAEAFAGRGSVLSGRAPEGRREVVFLFPGQGSQRPGAGAGLYLQEPVFREVVDRACEALVPELELDLREVLFPAEAAMEEAARRLRETRLAQPALFVVELALARLWRSWGIHPAAVAGHSIGELVAACVAGVFPEEDALALVAARGRLVQELPPGVMLAVALDADDLSTRLEGTAVDLAAANAPGRSVASGPAEAVAELEARLSADGVRHRRLETSHAFHSAMMDPAVPRLAERVARCERRAPKVPLVSSVTGEWLAADRATDPSYWSGHLRRPVRFDRALAAALRGPGEPRETRPVLLEVGPGTTLSGLVRRGVAGERPPVVASLADAADELRSMLDGLGRLWVAGCEVDWEAVHQGERRRRVPLPPPSLDRRRYWLQPGRTARGGAGRTDGRPGEARLLERTWTRASRRRGAGQLPATVWLLGDGRAPLARALGARLTDAGVAVAAAADRDGWSERLARSGVPEAVVVLGQAGGPDGTVRELEALAGALEAAPPESPVNVWVATVGLAEVTGDEELQPGNAGLLAACRRITARGGRVVCRVADLTAAGVRDGSAAEPLVSELAAPGDELLVACRGRYRWTPSLRVPDGAGEDPRPAGAGGRWLVVGGLDASGFDLARGLAVAGCQELAVTVPRALPGGGERAELLAAPDEDAEPSEKTLAALAAEAGLDLDLGAEALLALEGESAEERPGRPDRPDPEVERAVDELCAAYALRFLAPAFDGPGDDRSLDELAAGLGVEPRYRLLLRYLVGILEEEGQIERTDTGRLRPAFGDVGSSEPEVLRRELEARAPELAPGIACLAHCTRHLGDVVRGRLDATEVLFPGGDPSLLQGVMASQERYSWTGLLRTAIATALAAAARERMDGPAARPLRVLEIGAGLGGLTWPLLDALAGVPIEYHVTDVGRSFVLDARREAERRGLRPALDRGRLSLSVLDAAADPEAQGFAPHSYDAVLALDVVHATPRVAETFGHLRRLLVPGGWLLLLEPIRLQRWVSLIWGLTEGWWSFADRDLRPDSPLLVPEAWARVVAEAGLDGGAVLPTETADREEADHGLVVGRQPRGVLGPAHAEVLARGWRERREEAAGRLRRLSDLEATGAAVRAVATTPDADSALAWPGVAWGLDEADGPAAVAAARLLASPDRARRVFGAGLAPGSGEPWNLISVLRCQGEESPAAAPGRHARPELSVEYVEPASDDERAVAAVWQEVLGIDRVGAHDDFLDLGGDSLIATQLVSRLREALGVKVPVDRLLARPTVAGLAEEVAELRAEQDERRQARVLERLSSLSDEEAAMELVRLETATAGGGEP